MDHVHCRPERQVDIILDEIEAGRRELLITEKLCGRRVGRGYFLIGFPTKTFFILTTLFSFLLANFPSSEVQSKSSQTLDTSTAVGSGLLLDPIGTSPGKCFALAVEPSSYRLLPNNLLTSPPPGTMPAFPIRPLVRQRDDGLQLRYI